MDSKQAKLSWKQIVLGLLMLLIVIVIAGSLLLGIYKLFAKISPQVATAVTAIVAATLSAAITAISTKRSEKRMEIERQIREQKIPIYESFLSFWFKMVPGKGMPQSAMPQEEMIEFFREFTRKMITWGSGDVLKMYCEMRRVLMMQSSNPSSTGYAGIVSLEDMLFAIRRDLGHKNAGLKRGDVLALFIDDVDTILHENTPIAVSRN